jgi:hypothetical protein
VNKHRNVMTSAIHFVSFASGVALLWAMRALVES